MSEKDELTNSASSQEDVKEQVLCIEKVVGGYAGALGLQKGDIIAGVNGVPFYGDKTDFNALFDFDEEAEVTSSEEVTVLTIDRAGIFFNIMARMRVICSFKQVDATFSELPDSFQDALLSATSIELSEYLIYYDNSKNAELVLRIRSLMAMVAPPFWLLNQRMPEAAVTSMLAFVLTFAVNPILGAIFYSVLCLYIGREQLNLAMSFMSFKRMIFMQQIAAINELEAQKTAIAIDPELFFLRPASGLVQLRRKRSKFKKRQKPESASEEAAA